MKRFVVPVVITTVGYMVIKAESLDDAKAEAKGLQEDGISELDLDDSESDAKVLIDSITVEKCDRRVNGDRNGKCCLDDAHGGVHITSGGYQF